MNRAVYKSEEGRMLIEAAYRAHLDSPLGANLLKRSIETGMGSTFVVEESGVAKPPEVPRAGGRPVADKRGRDWVRETRVHL